MKQVILASIFSLIILFSMDSQAQTFRKINAGPFSLDVYNASQNSFGVASVIIYGQKDAVLIDAQFTLADAEKVALEIKNSGKNLTAIYISHGDPDYYFGLQVFKTYFPNVIAYAAPATVEHIKATAQKKLDVWGKNLGKAIASNVVLPQVLPGDSLELEGQKLEVIGLQEFPSNTFVSIPAAKAVIGGINVFGNTFHLWMADAQNPDARAKWISVLDKITSLQPEIVVPAHSTSNADFNLASVKYTRDYILFYEEALKKYKTSESLIKALKEKYPSAGFETETLLNMQPKTSCGPKPKDSLTAVLTPVWKRLVKTYSIGWARNGRIINSPRRVSSLKATASSPMAPIPQ
jgi:glyoxylase-like metal-dependent hydrolase (beta-lactamase superfamily II)